MTPLPTDKLFELARHGASPNARDRERVRARIAGAVAVGGTAALLATKKAFWGVSFLSNLPWGITMAGGILAIGAATAGIVVGTRDRTYVDSVPPVAASANAPSARAEQTNEKLEDQAPTAVPFADLPIEPSRHAATSPRVYHDSTSPTPEAKAMATSPEPIASSVPPAPSSAAEIALLGRMSQSLGRGDSSGALALVSEHERTYPTSAFAEEREGTRTVAQCMRQEDGPSRRTLMSTFFARFPNSPMRARIVSACGSRSITDGPRTGQ